MGNFQYCYNRHNFQNMSKTEKTKELRRLKKMYETRNRQIEKRNYKSYAKDKLLIRLEKAKTKEEKLLAYDKFLMSQTSTWQGIEKHNEDKIKGKWSNSINKAFNVNLNHEELSYVYYILDVIRDLGADSYVGYKDIVNAFCQSDFEPQTKTQIIENYLNKGKDDFYINELYNSLGIEL